MIDAQLDMILREIRSFAAIRKWSGRTDGELLRDFLDSGLEPAFAEIVRRHGAMVLGVCQRYLGSVPDAEDAFQATFLLLLRRASSVRKTDSLASWLHGVARRVAADTRRAAERRRYHEHQTPVRRSPDPVEQATLREVCIVLEEEIARLPEIYRDIFVLCCLERVSCAEVAERLNANEGTVRNRLSRARNMLRERLTRRGVTLSAGFAASGVVAAGDVGVVSASIQTSTVKSAAHLAAGGTLASSPVPAAVAALVEGGSRAMLPAAMKLVVAAVLAFGAAVFAVSVHQQAAQPYSPKNPPVKAAAIPAEREERKQGMDRHGDPLPPDAIARLGTSRFRHPGFSARGLAFSRDGQTVVAGGEGNVVRVWESATGKLSREIHLGKFICCGFALSPDGKLAAVGGFVPENGGQPATHGIRLIEIATGKLQRTLSRKDGMNQCALAFTPDGKHLASIGEDGIVRIEEASTGKTFLQQPFQFRYGLLTFSADGTCLAIGGPGTGTVSLWDWQTGNPPRPLKVPPRGANSLSFSRDGKILATGDDFQEGIRLWDVATGRQLKTVGTGEESAASQVCFSPDGRTLASTNQRHKALILWNAATGNELRRIKIRTPHLGDLVWSRDSSRVAVLDQGGVRVWEAATGKESPALPEGHLQRLSHAALLADGSAITAGNDRTVRLWDGKSSKMLRTIQVSDGLLYSTAVSPDGRWLATSTLGDDHAVCLWEITTGRLVFRQAGHGPLGGNRAVGFSADSKRLLSWGDDMFLRIWEVHSGKLSAEHAIMPDGEMVPDPKDAGGLRSRMGQYGIARYSPDGGLLVLSGREAFFVFDTKTGKQQRKIAHDQWNIEGMAISRDGTLLLTNILGRYRDLPLPDGRVRTTVSQGAIALHSLLTGKLVRELPHTRHMPGPVAFSADGKHFAATAFERDSRIEFYDTATGTLRSVIERVPGRILALGLSADGKRVIAGMEDSTALIWNIPEKLNRK